MSSEEGSYEAKRITCNKFYKYRIMDRIGEVSNISVFLNLNKKGNNEVT